MSKRAIGVSTTINVATGLGGRVVGLLQPIDKVELYAQRELHKVLDDVGALGHPNTYLELVRQRSRQQIAVVGNVGEGARRDAPRVDQIELVKSCRLDLAVHGHFIARSAFGRELVEDQALVRVEALVLKDERVVTGIAGQP